MDAKLKAKWVRALRSGKYRQARKILRAEDGSLCCLGVLCKVAKLRIAVDGSGVYEGAAFVGYRPIYELVGGDDGSDARELSMRNDGHRSYTTGGEPWSFEQIADYIEANL